MSYFYLNDKKESIGPYTPKELNSLLQAGLITRSTLIATKGGASWAPYHENFPDVAPVVTTPAEESSSTSYEQALREPKNLVIDRDLWGWTVFLGVASLILVALEEYNVFHQKERWQTFSLLVLLASATLMLTILHKCWSALPQKFRNTGPNKATFLLLIPVFHLYWVFVSVKSLAENMNRWDHEQGNPINKETVTAATVCSVLFAILSGYDVLEVITTGGEETTSTFFGATLYTALSIAQFIAGWIVFDSVIRRINAHFGVIWEDEAS